MQIYINNLKSDIRLELEIKGIPLSTLKAPKDYQYHLGNDWLYNHAYSNHVGEAINELLAEYV